MTVQKVIWILLIGTLLVAGFPINSPNNPTENERSVNYEAYVRQLEKKHKLIYNELDQPWQPILDEELADSEELILQREDFTSSRPEVSEEPKPSSESPALASNDMVAPETEVVNATAAKDPAADDAVAPVTEVVNATAAKDPAADDAVAPVAEVVKTAVAGDSAADDAVVPVTEVVNATAVVGDSATDDAAVPVPVTEVVKADSAGDAAADVAPVTATNTEPALDAIVPVTSTNEEPTAVVANHDKVAIVATNDNAPAQTGETVTSVTKSATQVKISSSVADDSIAPVTATNEGKPQEGLVVADDIILVSPNIKTSSADEGSGQAESSTEQEIAAASVQLNEPVEDKTESTATEINADSIGETLNKVAQPPAVQSDDSIHDGSGQSDPVDTNPIEDSLIKITKPIVVQPDDFSHDGSGQSEPIEEPLIKVAEPLAAQLGDREGSGEPDTTEADPATESLIKVISPLVVQSDDAIVEGSGQSDPVKNSEASDVIKPVLILDEVVTESLKTSEGSGAADLSSLAEDDAVEESTLSRTESSNDEIATTIQPEISKDIPSIGTVLQTVTFEASPIVLKKDAVETSTEVEPSGDSTTIEAKDVKTTDRPIQSVNQVVIQSSPTEINGVHAEDSTEAVSNDATFPTSNLKQDPASDDAVEPVTEILVISNEAPVAVGDPFPLQDEEHETTTIVG